MFSDDVETSEPLSVASGDAPLAVWSSSGDARGALCAGIWRMGGSEAFSSPMTWKPLSLFLSLRAMRADLKEGRTLSVTLFKQRVSQIMSSYSAVSQGDHLNFYPRLLRGMPARHATCRANKYGLCGK